MKTACLFLASSAFLLAAGSDAGNSGFATAWYAELAAIQQASDQQFGGRVRAEAIVHAAIVGATSGLAANGDTGRPAETAPPGASLGAATAQAAFATMLTLYPGQAATLEAALARSLADLEDTTAAIAAGRDWGRHVARVVLAEHADAVFLNPLSLASDGASPVAEKSVAGQGEASAPGRYRFRVLAGTPGVLGSLDGVGAAARIGRIGGLAVDANDNIYFSEQGTHLIRRVTREGVVTTLAGTPGAAGFQDGPGAEARFNNPVGVAADRSGNVFVADHGNNAIRKIDPSGVVSTLARSPVLPAATPPVPEGQFMAPSYVAVDGAGNVFFTESGTGGGIVKVTPEGHIARLRVRLTLDTHFSSSEYPVQISADAAGTLHVIYSDFWNFSELVKLTPGADGGYDGERILPNPRALNQPFPPFAWAQGFGFDRSGNLYIHYYAAPILRRSPEGDLSVQYVAEDAEAVADTDMVVTSRGELVIAPGSGTSGQDGTIRIGTFDPSAVGPMIAGGPDDSSVREGSKASFTVIAAGTPAPTYQWYFNSQPISGATAATFELPAAQLSDAGTYHVVVADSGGSVVSKSARLSVSAAPPPAPVTPSSPAVSAGAGGGGGAPSLAFLLALAALSAAARRHRRRHPSITRRAVVFTQL